MRYSAYLVIHAKRESATIHTSDRSTLSKSDVAMRDDRGFSQWVNILKFFRRAHFFIALVFSQLVWNFQLLLRVRE